MKPVHSFCVILRKCSAEDLNGRDTMNTPDSLIETTVNIEGVPVVESSLSTDLPEPLNSALAVVSSPGRVYPDASAYGFVVSNRKKVDKNLSI